MREVGYGLSLEGASAADLIKAMQTRSDRWLLQKEKSMKASALIRKFAVFFFSCSLLLVGQTSNGELRLRVTDPSGLAVKASIQIVSEVNQYRRVLGTDDQGALTLQRLPFGVYQIQIREPGFAEISQSINLHSSIPTELRNSVEAGQSRGSR